MSVFDKRYLWVLDADACGGVRRVVSLARRANLGICAKWNDGDPSDDGRWGFQRKFHHLAELALPSGIPLLAWGYCYGDRYGALEAEISAAADVLGRYPEVGYVIDAEGEWECPGGGEWARRLLDGVLSRNPDAAGRLAYTPFWNTRWHRQYPARVFSQYCSAVMPQTYFETGKRKTRPERDEMIRVMVEDYGKLGLPLHPIGEIDSGTSGISDFIEIVSSLGIRFWSWWVLDGFQGSPEFEHLCGT